MNAPFISDEGIHGPGLTRVLPHFGWVWAFGLSARAGLERLKPRARKFSAGGRHYVKKKKKILEGSIYENV